MSIAKHSIRAQLEVDKNSYYCNKNAITLQTSRMFMQLRANESNKPNNAKGMSRTNAKVQCSFFFIKMNGTIFLKSSMLTH